MTGERQADPEAIYRSTYDPARTWLRVGSSETALSVVAPVLAIPFKQRISQLPRRLSRVSTALATPHFQGSAKARHFDQQIDLLAAKGTAAQLRDRPATPN